MAVSKETLRAIIRDYGGFELSDEEFELIRPELESYLVEAKKMGELELSGVFSSRLMRLPLIPAETGRPDNG